MITANIERECIMSVRKCTTVARQYPSRIAHGEHAINRRPTKKLTVNLDDRHLDGSREPRLPRELATQIVYRIPVRREVHELVFDLPFVELATECRTQRAIRAPINDYLAVCSGLRGTRDCYRHYRDG